MQNREKNCISISVFGYEDMEKFPVFVSKNTFKRHVDLLLIEEEGQSLYVLVKDFSTFIYNQTIHRDRKHVSYCTNIRKTCYWLFWN